MSDTDIIEAGPFELKAQSAAPPMPMELIDKAIETGNVESLERLMDLQERWEASQARKAFFAAMAQFQGQCPGIGTRGQADRYKYARLEDIMTVITPLLSQNGLNITFNTEQSENALTVTTHVHHVGGHTQSTTFAVPVPEIRGTNETQKMGAANSYARRYGIVNALNLRIMGEDNDGQYRGISDETITPVQAENIQTMIDELGTHMDLGAFLRLADAESVADIRAHHYNDLIRMLDTKRAQVRASRKAKEGDDE